MKLHWSRRWDISKGHDFNRYIGSGSESESKIASCLSRKCSYSEPLSWLKQQRHVRKGIQDCSINVSQHFQSLDVAVSRSHFLILSWLSIQSAFFTSASLVPVNFTLYFKVKQQPTTECHTLFRSVVLFCHPVFVSTFSCTFSCIPLFSFILWWLLCDSLGNKFKRFSLLLFYFLFLVSWSPSPLTLLFARVLGWCWMNTVALFQQSLLLVLINVWVNFLQGRNEGNKEASSGSELKRDREYSREQTGL